MNRTILATLTRVSVVAILPLLPLGCNKDEDIPADAFRVTPASANLAKSGDSVVLQAVGGLEPMTWTLSATNSAMGTISGSGRMVTFTRGTASGANTVQVMDDRSWTAATVLYLDAQTTPTSPEALAVSPTAITLSDNRDTAVFIATKGTQPYRWSIADSALGSLDTASGNQVVYTRTRAGNNTIILTDASNIVVTATVTQPDSTTALSISPTSQTLANNGETAVFVAAGGTEPYTWYVADAARGHLSGNSGSSVVYTRDSEGNNSVVLRDRYGNTVVAAITQSSSGSALSVTPTSANIATDGDIAVFVASGGTEPYTWSVALPARGTLDSAHGTSVIYTRTAAGNNTIQLSDGDGSTIAINIIQADSTSTLTVTPGAATLNAAGDMVVFTATGGTPPYTWDVDSSASGDINRTDGQQVVYTRGSGGGNYVFLTDAASNTVYALVTQQ